MAGSIQTERVFVCTNAWASAMLDVDVAPAPNVVVVSQPLPHLALNQTLHHDRGYVYARAVRGRLLIGGGRHWNCDDDAERGQMLVHWAQTHIQGAERFDIDHQWVGQLGVGAQRMPIVKSSNRDCTSGFDWAAWGWPLAPTWTRPRSAVSLKLFGTNPRNEQGESKIMNNFATLTGAMLMVLASSHHVQPTLKRVSSELKSSNKTIRSSPTGFNTVRTATLTSDPRTFMPKTTSNACSAKRD